MPVQLEHIDPAQAQRDAETAATRAFDRAQGRSSMETTLFPAPRSPERATRDRRNTGEGLQRQQTVRFVGPCSVLGRLALNRRGNPEHRSCPAALADETDSHNPALVAFEDHTTPEDEIASVPSSYRRLRRSRSLAMPIPKPASLTGQWPHVPYSVSSHVPMSQSHQERMLMAAPTPTLRAPKSMSFLRTRREHKRSVTSCDEPDIATEFGSRRPRAGGFRNPQPHHGLKSQPSQLFPSKTGRTETSMRRSLRSSSSNSYAPSATSNQAFTVGKEGSLRDRARKVSRGLKKRIKSLLNMSKANNADSGLPHQHVEAQRTHVFEHSGRPPFQRGGSSDDFDYTETGSCLGQVSSQLPYLHNVPSSQKLRSRQGSVESLQSERRVSDEKSRVTSWTSSGPGTLDSQAAAGWGEWERQRLSIIRENGPHAPSPSLRRLAAAANLAPHPESTELQTNSQPPLLSPTVDSQRVYSALLKRLQETRQLADIVERQRRSSGDGYGPHARGSLDEMEEPAQGQRSTPRTIQCVDSAAGCFQGAREQKPVDVEFEKPPVSQPVRRREGSGSRASSGAYRAYPQPTLGDNREPSAPVLPTQPTADVPGGPARTISHRSSAFFGSPDRHLFRTASPYRRALQASMKEAEPDPKILKVKEVCRVAAVNAQQNRVDTCSPEDERNATAYSESVYSNVTEEGPAILRETQALMNDFPEPPKRLSDSHGPSYTVLLSAGPRVTSTASSVDWKTWLAANVAKLEPLQSPILPGDTDPTKPDNFSPNVTKLYGRGHVRESAQIDTEDGQPPPLPPPTPPSRRLVLPSTPLSVVEPNVIKISPSQPPASTKRIASSPAVTGLNLNENENPHTRPFLGETRDNGRDSSSPSFIPPPPPPPPPIPPRSASRPRPPSTGATTSNGSGSNNNNKSVARKSAGPTPPHAEGGQTYGQRVASAAARKSRSLARMRSLNRLRASATGSPNVFPPSPSPEKMTPPTTTGKNRTTRKQQQQASAAATIPTGAGTSHLEHPMSAGASMESSPGLTAAVERQFGPAAASGLSARALTEPSSEGGPGVRRGEGSSGGRVVGSLSHQGEWLLSSPEVMGSQRMVDLFLNSRRRRMVSSEDSAAFL